MGIFLTIFTIVSIISLMILDFRIFLIGFLALCLIIAITNEGSNELLTFFLIMTGVIIVETTALLIFEHRKAKRKKQKEEEAQNDAHEAIDNEWEKLR